MSLNGLQLVGQIIGLSFEEALVEAEMRHGELCFVYISEKSTIEQGMDVANIRLWVLNKGGTGSSFYREHYRKKGYFLCVAPHWLVNKILGI